MLTENHHCFEISFPSVDFDSYLSRSENVKTMHHAHLFPDRDAIEIHIFFEPNTHFGEKLSRWAYDSDWEVFGKSIVAEISSSEKRLQGLDFTNSKLQGIRGSMGASSIILSIDSFIGYWPVNKARVGTGEFYLSEPGFHIVKHFYAPLLPGLNGQFAISRRRTSKKDRKRNTYFKIGTSKFRPEFFLRPMGNIEDREERIIKEPRIHFKYSANLKLGEALRQAEVVRNLMSFYSHSSIDYITSIVYLEGETIITRKVPTQSPSKPLGNLQEFGNDMDWDAFLGNDWKLLLVEENSMKLDRLVELFLQSLLVKGGSRFLIYWTMLEICSKTKPEAEQFMSRLSKEGKNKKFKEAFEILSEIVSEEDKIEFEKRWENTSSQLMNKPMAGAILKFLLNEKIDPNTWPISLKKLQDIRNRIAHGSTNEVSSQELRRANMLLYRIAGILILKLLGIQQWELGLSLQ